LDETAVTYVRYSNAIALFFHLRATDVYRLFDRVTVLQNLASNAAHRIRALPITNGD